MPIRVTNSSYTDFPFGAVTSFLQSNAGNTVRGDWEIEESISVLSDAGTTITRDPITSTYEWLGGDFEAEGFRPGDSINVIIFDSISGAVINTHSTTVSWVDGSEMNVASVGTQWYTFPDSRVAINNTRNREGMELYFNMVSNASSGSDFSLIDGEVTRFIFDLQNPALPVITAPGNRSGAYEIQTCTIGLLSSGSGVNTYRLRIEFVQSGIYNSTLFDFNNCLKVYLGMNWQSLFGEPYSNTLEVVNEEANTGWFNQAYNNDIIDANLVEGIGALGYDSVTSGTFKIDSTSSQYAQGSAYIPGDDNYFKIKPQNQSELAMLIASDEVVIVGTPRSSEVNPDGAGYDFEITNVTLVGTIYEVSYTFTPNAAFTTFMEGRQEGDRKFYVWMRWGKVNVLVFNDQLTKQPPVTGLLRLERRNWYDHSQQLTDGNGLENTYTGNIEDDFGFVGKFRYNSNDVGTYVRVGVRAYNTVTEEFFVLQQTNFNIANIPTDNTSYGAYILNETQAVNTALPTTSVKRQVELVRDTSIDIASAYGVRLYYPYIYRWEYWIELLNANSDFYPDEQTRNWLPYGTTGNWVLQLFFENDRNGDAYANQYQIGIKSYDSDANIQQTIDLYRLNPVQQVQVIVEGEVMRIVAEHTLLNGASWQQSTVWGMITVEPTESNPRWLSSTVVPFDNNTSNPLTPISGTVATLSFPTPDVARIECLFDSSNINLTNDVKFTTKIKGCFWP